MSERKQLTVWVSESQIENWDDYQEELGFQNRAEMIRRAVEYFYSQKTGDSEENENAVIESRLDDIEDKIGRTKADVNDVLRKQLEKEDMDDVAEEVAFRLSEVLQSDLMETLPEDYQDELESEIEEARDKVDDME